MVSRWRRGGASPTRCTRWCARLADRACVHPEPGVVCPGFVARAHAPCTLAQCIEPEGVMRVSMLVVSGLVVIGGCGGSGSGGTAPGGGGGGGGLVHASRVTATAGRAFDPSSVTIPAGDTIYFTFQGGIHNVVFDTQGNPGDVGNTDDATVKRKFTAAGTFTYHCSIHTQMTGTVTVTP